MIIKQIVVVVQVSIPTYLECDFVQLVGASSLFLGQLFENVVSNADLFAPLVPVLLLGRVIDLPLTVEVHLLDMVPQIGFLVCQCCHTTFCHYFTNG